MIAVALAAVCGCSGREQVTFDCVITGGTIVDGTENPRYRSDIGIRGGKIEKIGEISSDAGALIIDASGKIVAPGFIDIHTHADGRILKDRTAHNFVMQGVTTVVGGNCGGGGMNLKDMFADIESNSTALNIGVLVGHNSVRSKVMGNEGREPTDGELEAMKRIVEEEMLAGALGLSTGLKYRPGVYAKTDEVVELAKVAARYGGFYASHLRDEGLKFFEAIDEALLIGERAGIPVQLSHHKAVGKDMWGASETSLGKIEDARARGIDVTADQYAYTATFTGIAILFPEWALEGDREAINARLNDPGTHRRIVAGIVENIRHDRGGGDIGNVTIASCAHDNSLEGKNLAEILEMKGRELTETNAAELLIELYEDGGASAVYHCLSEEDVVRIMRHPLVMHASDASITEFDRGEVHPRNYGNFPRILGYYVRDEGILTLEEAVRKMTSFPASRIGARSRGMVSEECFADLVVFDPETIADTATWTEPHSYPEGIEYVLVNGAVVVDRGVLTDRLPGKVVYGPGKER